MIFLETEAFSRINSQTFDAEPSGPHLKHMKRSPDGWNCENIRNSKNTEKINDGLSESKIDILRDRTADAVELHEMYVVPLLRSQEYTECDGSLRLFLKSLLPYCREHHDE